MRVRIQWRPAPGAPDVTPPAARLAPRNTCDRLIDAIPVVVDVPAVELYALRLSDRFNEETWTAEGIPHLARGLSGAARVGELRASVVARLRVGRPPFQAPIEVDFGPNKPGPYVQDGHHRLGIALELGIRTVPVQVPRGIARRLGWFDLGARRFAADHGMAGSNEYDVFRSTEGEAGLAWVARWQRLPEELGGASSPAVFLGRYATQAEAMYACELNANGRTAPDWWRDREAMWNAWRSRSTEGVCRSTSTRSR